MKYSFRLIETGPKATVSNNWGQARYLLACAQCGTINLKLQTTCILCGHALHVRKTPANNPVAAGATAPATAMGGKDFSASKEFPDMLKNPPVAAASQPAPDMMMANRRFDGFDKQKWLRRTWALMLLLVLLAATGLLFFSLLQSPSPSSDAAKYISKNANGVTMPAPAADAKQKANAPDKGFATPAPGPAQYDTRTSTDANVIENRMAKVAADRMRSVPEAAVATAPQQSAAAANARCTDAQQALALCN